MSPLAQVGLRYLRRHIGQSLLMAFGIALGVAVMVAIDLANASAGRAFELSTETVAGRATHQITGGPAGLPDTLFAALQRAGVEGALAPVIAAYVASPELGGQPLQLFGIDPFSEAPFRSYLGGDQAPPPDQLSAFLTQPGALLVSADLAARYGLELGDRIQIQYGGRTSPALIAGLLQPQDDLARRSLSGLVLADIATAQELTGRVGTLDRIDLLLPDANPARLDAIRALLPAGAALGPVIARGSVIEQMTDAFRVNLTALSLLALLVGLFLIYNTMTFSVVQRRGLFGTLRCLGVTRAEIFRLVLTEALAVGALGALVGVGLGVLMGQGTVRAVLQTINDLYFTTTISDLGLPVSSLVKGFAVGVLATLATAAPPAWEAASVPPRAALARSGLESKASARLPLLGWLGLGVLAFGSILFLLPAGGIYFGFAGTLAVVIGFALLAAVSLALLMRILTPLTGRLFGALGRMAPRNLVNALSRTAVAVSALMVAVAVTIGVNLMIASFRHTVIIWLEQSLQSDVYISSPSFTQTGPSIPIDPGAIPLLTGGQAVSRADLLRLVNVASPVGEIQVIATDNRETGRERFYQWRTGTPEELWRLVEEGSVIVSEPLAVRLGLPRRGGEVTLNTPTGPRSFPVVGVFYDYANSQGSVLMDLALYRLIWDDPAITAIGLRLAPGADPDAVAAALQEQVAPVQQLVIRPNRALRADVLEVFDRTFAITGALQVLATAVAFMGVLNALLLLQLEKQREVGILRSLGLTARQLWRLVMLETGLMGLTAGLTAIPTGYALALILVYIINRRSFGWTLQMDVTPLPFLQALAIALVAALLAGLYPARKLGRMPASDAIRFE